MLKLLKSLLGGVGGLFGHLFGLLGSTVELVAKLPMAVLDLFGLIPPVPQQQAADEAEEAAAQAQQQHFGSTVDRRPAVVVTPQQKLEQISRWCYWRSGVEPGPEPSLDGLTTREKLKLKSADPLTVQALTLRTLPRIEEWMQSPKKALKPFTQAEIERVQRPLEIENRKSEEVFGRRKAGADRYDARPRGSDVIAEAEELIEASNALLKPRGLAFA
jgi:hypothetical protein